MVVTLFDDLTAIVITGAVKNAYLIARRCAIGNDAVLPTKRTTQVYCVIIAQEVGTSITRIDPAIRIIQVEGRVFQRIGWRERFEYLHIGKVKWDKLWSLINCRWLLEPRIPFANSLPLIPSKRLVGQRLLTVLLPEIIISDKLRIVGVGVDVPHSTPLASVYRDEEIVFI